MRLADALLGALGRRVDVSAPDAIAVDGGVRVPLGRGLRGGWYMLEIEPGERCIGAALELRADGLAPVHLLLSPKLVVKRVVRLPRAVDAPELFVAREGATLRRVALVPLTRRFAASRLRAKLRYGGSSAARRARAARRRDVLSPGGDGRTALDALYADYARHVERHVRPIAYADWRARYAIAPVAPAPLDATRSLPRVELAMSSGEPDGRVAASLAAAREAGLDVVPFDPAGRPADDRFVLFLDAGTVPEPALLPILVAALGPRTRLCYADSDRLDADGRRVEPAFKPDWNPELLLARDYVGDAFLCRADVPGCLEAARAGSVAARRELLAAAALELEGEAVAHVPEILSSARADEAHDRVALLGRVLAARGNGARALPGPLPGTARVRWPRPTPAPSVDVIVPTRDRADVLEVCLESLLGKTVYPRYRVTVVDNDSVEPATRALHARFADDARVRVLPFAGAFNYSAINNHAVARSDADVVVLLNNDTEILHADWLDELVRLAIRPENGCVGAKLYYSNDLIQHAGVVVGITGVAGHAHRFLPRAADGYGARLKLAQNVTAVTAACLAVRRELYERLGGLDAEALAVAYNDVDFCLRAHAAGYRNVWTPAVELYHHESLSRGADDTPEKRSRARREFETMRTRWRLAEFDDPAYNPNLTIDHEDFGLAA